jgi:uncharacterized OB-fold protein
MIEGIPLPVTDDPVDAEFWRGTKQSKLLIQRCMDCDARRFPPRPMCPACQSQNCHWEQVSGRGRVWSFAAPASPLLPAFEKLRPYITALVELDEDPSLRIIGPVVLAEKGNIKGVELSDVNIGDPVNAVFKSFAEDVNIVCWALQGNEQSIRNEIDEH